MLYCFVDNTGVNNRLLWRPPDIGPLSLDDVTTEQSNGGFVARTVSMVSNTYNSSLTFTAVSKFDERIVECTNNQFPVTTDNCTLLVYSKYSVWLYCDGLYLASPSNDTELMVTGITYQSVSLSWSTPTDTGGYSNVNYIITITLLSASTSWNVSVICLVTRVAGE